MGTHASDSGGTTAGSGARGAALTRALLVLGAVVGPLYLVVGIAQALTRDGFDPARHPLSLLTLGDWGWIQVANLVVSGALVLLAAWGLGRALRGHKAWRALTALVALYGVCVLLSGVFLPDPMAGFPAGVTETAIMSPTGLLHLVLGLIGFLSLASAALAGARWSRAHGHGVLDAFSWVSAIVIVLGFVLGGALATQVTGVLLLWLVVLVAWAWLAAVSLTARRTVAAA
jgi:hypothetical protein